MRNGILFAKVIFYPQPPKGGFQDETNQKVPPGGFRGENLDMGKIS
jgi:hypothetical protein